MNSRVSYHGGWTGPATDQMLADVLDAASRASAIGRPMAIYVATSANVSLYDPSSNSLTVHKAGDWRSDTSAAFEVGIASDEAISAGAAMHLAQLESIALWSGTASQLASCPRASATTYANSYWDLPAPVDIVVSFGMRNVAGFTTTLVAVSSDGSLPNPRTDGAVYMDDAMAEFAYGSTFDDGNLPLEEISQILWASYGCSNHVAAGKAGLVCSSAVANYYLTRRVYYIGADGAYRYHNRRPPGTDATTRDHRIEVITAGDVRPALRQGASDLPTAPAYLIFCIGAPGAWPELEVGFAAMGALIEASTAGRQGYLTTGFSSETQAAIRAATGIPTPDLPMAIVSLGFPSNPAGVHLGQESRDAIHLSTVDRVASGGTVELRYRLPIAGTTSLIIYDCQGQEVRRLMDEKQDAGGHVSTWDCRNAGGSPVPSGVYFCRLRMGPLIAGAQFVVVR